MEGYQNSQKLNIQTSIIFQKNLKSFNNSFDGMVEASH